MGGSACKQTWVRTRKKRPEPGPVMTTGGVRVPYDDCSVSGSLRSMWKESGLFPRANDPGDPSEEYAGRRFL